MRVSINIDIAVDTIVERLVQRFPQLSHDETEIGSLINQAICDVNREELNSWAKYIIDYLLRGYKKGYGTDLNSLENNLEDSDYPEWLEAIKQLSEISASTQADMEIARLERVVKEQKEK